MLSQIPSAWRSSTYRQVSLLSSLYRLRSWRHISVLRGEEFGRLFESFERDAVSLRDPRRI